MFREFKSPTWHIPLPWLTGENAKDASLWREHMVNRVEMGARFMTHKTTDYPWSSWLRLQGVILVSLTFGAWVVSGIICVLLLLFGSTPMRVAIVTYFAMGKIAGQQPFNQSAYDYVGSLEAGATNGWRLLVLDDKAKASPMDQQSNTIDCSKKPHLFCSHPHGLFCAGVSLNVIHSKKALTLFKAKRIRLMVHFLLVNAFPLIKDWLRALGQMPCDRKTCTRLLKSGESCAIVPGGVREVVWSGRVDKEHLYLSDVYGFIKLAIQCGTPLVPVYTFGESLSMGPDWVPLFKLRRKISYYLNAPIRFLSITQRWCMPFPNGRLVTVVGLPIDPGVVESEPSRDRVKELHGKYLESLLKMIEDTKEEAGYPMQVTVVV